MLPVSLSPSLSHLICATDPTGITDFTQNWNETKWKNSFEFCRRFFILIWFLLASRIAQKCIFELCTLHTHRLNFVTRTNRSWLTLRDVMRCCRMICKNKRVNESKMQRRNTICLFVCFASATEKGKKENLLRSNIYSIRHMRFRCDFALFPFLLLMRGGMHMWWRQQLNILSATSSVSMVCRHWMPYPSALAMRSRSHKPYKPLSEVTKLRCDCATTPDKWSSENRARNLNENGNLRCASHTHILWAL